MIGANYERRRREIETYFDRTAADTWARLTSDAPVSRIRQTVREGRDTMRATLLGWLPEDLNGKRVLDAGCGTGALALEAASRGAEVVAIDLSATLVELAQARAADISGVGSIDFLVGDMRALDLGCFDHVVAMDSLIHYDPEDGMRTLEALAENVTGSMVFTFAPKTRLLATMHSVGQWFPRGNRSPAIVPISVDELQRTIDASPALLGWQRQRSVRVNRGFYISQAMELTRL